MRATADHKTRALQFVESMRSDGLSFLLEDLVHSLKVAAKLPGKRKVLIYVGDGLVFSTSSRRTPAASVAEVTRHNTDKVTIHTFGVAPHPESEEFLRSLARHNGGTYRRAN